MADTDILQGPVTLAHGAGGRAMAELIDVLFRRHFANPLLDRGNDQACFRPPPGRLVLTTDGFVVSPLVFPGGDIGRLAVNGTVNDLAMGGGRPLCLTAGFILEEGLGLDLLDRIVRSMAEAAEEAAVAIVTGDTKVVEHGKGDGLFITTTGLGVVPEGVSPSVERARPGDSVLVSGPVGDHGMTILAVRDDLGLEGDLVSDTRPLSALVSALVAAVPGVHVLRDPTRGGLSATLNEIAQAAGVGVVLEETAIPVRPAVRAGCALLGLDPLTLACEGRLVAICDADDAEAALAVLRDHPDGREAAVIGRVVADDRCFVRMHGPYGGNRLVDWLAGEPLPRIC